MYIYRILYTYTHTIYIKIYSITNPYLPAHELQSYSTNISAFKNPVPSFPLHINPIVESGLLAEVQMAIHRFSIPPANLPPLQTYFNMAKIQKETNNPCSST